MIPVSPDQGIVDVIVRGDFPTASISSIMPTEYIKPLLADILDAGCEGKHPRWSSLAAANKRGRRGGHPRAMNEQTIKHAEAMLKDTENYPFIGDVIDQLKIGRTAFYRYFPTDRIKQLRNEHETNLQTG